MVRESHESSKSNSGYAVANIFELHDVLVIYRHVVTSCDSNKSQLRVADDNCKAQILYQVSTLASSLYNDTSSSDATVGMNSIYPKKHGCKSTGGPKLKHSRVVTSMRVNIAPKSLCSRSQSAWI